MKPTLLLYGNCQAGAVGVILAADPAIAEAYNIVHIASFEDRIPDIVEAGPETIAASTVFFEQYDPNPFPKADLIGPDCVKVAFPAVDLHLLWPLDCVNIYNDEPTPDAIWGHFPYGDRAVVDAIKSGVSAHELIRTYIDVSTAQMPDLNRFEKLERARLGARDIKCDVKMADFVMSNFRDHNLFWTMNHPTMVTLRELCRRLIAAVAARSPALANAELDATIATLPPEGPLSDVHAPIHPAVVEHFGLKWYPREGAHFGLRNERLTYQEYLERMITTAARVRDGQATEKTVVRG